MIVNSAFLAAMILLLLAFSILGQVEFLAPYRHVIFVQHLWVVVGSVVVMFLNLFAVCYLAGRGLFLKDTGRKLAHVERQLRTTDDVQVPAGEVFRLAGDFGDEGVGLFAHCRIRDQVSGVRVQRSTCSAGLQACSLVDLHSTIRAVDLPV